MTFNEKDVARVRELLAIPDEIGSQDDPSPAVNKASFAQEAALRKRDAEVFKLARKLIETRDAKASRAVFEHVRANPTRWVAGELALALVGVRKHATFMAVITVPKIDYAAPLEVLRELAKLFETHRPPNGWKKGTSYLNHSRPWRTFGGRASWPCCSPIASAPPSTFAPSSPPKR